MGVWSKKYSQLFLFNCTVQWDFNGIIDTALAKSLYVKLCQIYLLNNIAMEFLIESNLRSSVSHLFCATRVFILIFCFFVFWDEGETIPCVGFFPQYFESQKSRGVSHWESKIGLCVCQLWKEGERKRLWLRESYFNWLSLINIFCSTWWKATSFFWDFSVRSNFLISVLALRLHFTTALIFKKEHKSQWCLLNSIWESHKLRRKLVSYYQCGLMTIWS